MMKTCEETNTTNRDSQFQVTKNYFEFKNWSKDKYLRGRLEGYFTFKN